MKQLRLENSAIFPIEYPATGEHCFFNLYNCNRKQLDDISLAERFSKCLVEDLGFTDIGTMSYKFNPQGVTHSRLLSQSHLNLHTWPELGTLLGDIFACGNPINRQTLAASLRDTFGVAPEIVYYKRGRNSALSPTASSTLPPIEQCQTCVAQHALHSHI
jgi:S-adenosylmethionine decarboxylase